MTKGAKFGGAWHLLVTVWCFVAMAMTTLNPMSDAASARSWTNVRSSIVSVAGNVDEEASFSPDVSADVFSAQQNVKSDDLRTTEAGNKLKTELVVMSTHIKENQRLNYDKKLATESNSKSGSEMIVVHDQNATAESSEVQPGIVRIISIKLWNQIDEGNDSENSIQVKCQGLKDDTVINEFDFVPVSIIPDVPYTWTIMQENDQPNVVNCSIYWDSQDSYMTYVLYQDSYLAHWQYGHWYVDEKSLDGYRDDVGFVSLQTWQKEVHVGQMLE